MTWLLYTFSVHAIFRHKMLLCVYCTCKISAHVAFVRCLYTQDFGTICLYAAIVRDSRKWFQRQMFIYNRLENKQKRQFIFSMDEIHALCQVVWVISRIYNLFVYQNIKDNLVWGLRSFDIEWFKHIPYHCFIRKKANKLLKYKVNLYMKSIACYNISLPIEW